MALTDVKRRARSGVDEHGTWTPAFAGQRPPFEKGNKLQSRHDLFSRLTNTEDRAEVEAAAQWLLSLVPAEDASFASPFAQVVAGMLVRWSRANQYVLEHSFEECSESLLRNLPVLENSLLRALRGLGLTPEGLANNGLPPRAGHGEGGDADGDHEYEASSREREVT